MTDEKNHTRFINLVCTKLKCKLFYRIIKESYRLNIRSYVCTQNDLVLRGIEKWRVGYLWRGGRPKKGGPEVNTVSDLTL
jgi:hypothetical protein